MPYTKPVIREPYYECPVWIENEVDRKEYICLSSSSTPEDVELFLVHLFGYSNIDVKQSLKDSFRELLEKDQVAILGGIAFFDDENRSIMPSCCCGLEEWAEVHSSIHNKISPWMGHDPYPGITYHDNFIRVLSDAPEESSKKKLFCIEYTYEEIYCSLEETKNDLLGFIKKPLFLWINSRDQEIAQRTKQKMYEWFMKDIVG